MVIRFVEYEGDGSGQRSVIDISEYDGASRLTLMRKFGEMLDRVLSPGYATEAIMFERIVDDDGT